MFISDNIGTIQNQTWEFKTWRGLMILEHFRISDDGNEINLLAGGKSYLKKQLKVLRS